MKQAPECGSGHGSSDGKVWEGGEIKEKMKERACLCRCASVCIEGVTGKQKGLEMQKMKEKTKPLCVGGRENET